MWIRDRCVAEGNMIISDLIMIAARTRRLQYDQSMYRPPERSRTAAICWARPGANTKRRKLIIHRKILKKFFQKSIPYKNKKNKNIYASIFS
jgi:hypothetical protein